MTPCPLDLSQGERDLVALARHAGALDPDEAIPQAWLEFALAVVQACAVIGDGYWQDDASAGQHIRAVFHP